MSDAGADEWRAVTAQQPPLRQPVRIMWLARKFRAFRTNHPKTRKHCWAVVKADGNLRYLPPKGDETRTSHRWGPNPDCWQPENLAKWDHAKFPLPPPLPQQIVPRMVNVRERKRRHRNRGDIDSQVERRQLWRDGLVLGDDGKPRPMIYQPAGEVSRAMAEARVMRAVAVAGVYGHKVLGGMRPAAQVERELAIAAEIAAKQAAGVEIEIDDPELMPRFVPHEEDNGDWLTAMAWFCTLWPPEHRAPLVPIVQGRWHVGAVKPPPFNELQCVLIWRAKTPADSWRRISEHFDCSHTWARKLYDEATDTCWEAANGRLARVDHIAAVQESNRAFRRRETTAA